jgi:hypothetical protein
MSHDVAYPVQVIQELSHIKQELVEASKKYPSLQLQESLRSLAIESEHSVQPISDPVHLEQISKSQA